MNKIISLNDIRCSQQELFNDIGETSGVFCGKLSDTYLNDCDCSIEYYEGTAMDALVLAVKNGKGMQFFSIVPN